MAFFKQGISVCSYVFPVLLTSCTVEDEVRLDSPAAICIDVHDNLYIADSNHTISKVTWGGGVSVVAGSAGLSGSNDGHGSDARFSNPRGITVDARGYLYVIDGLGGSVIRKISPGGLVSTWAGKPGQTGNADGHGSSASFMYPDAIVVDSRGNAYVTDTYNQTVRKISAGGQVTTLAGKAGHRGRVDGLGSEARFTSPRGIVMDSDQTLYVADAGSIRRISPSGQVSTLTLHGASSQELSVRRTVMRPSDFVSMAIDQMGGLYLADASYGTISKVFPSIGFVAEMAGKAGRSGHQDGIGDQARFGFPRSIALDSEGNIYVSDQLNRNIRQVTPEGEVTTVLHASARSKVALSENAH